MTDNNRTISPKLKTIIAVLLILVIVSAGALAVRVVYLRYFAENGTTVVVPDNLIGEGSTTSENTQPSQLESSAPGRAAAARNVDAPAATVAPEVKEEATSIELYKGQPSDNEKFQVRNMLPGDSVTKYFAVKVNHGDRVDLYFSTVVTYQTKRLGNALNIKITAMETNEVIYEGSLAAMDAAGYSQTLAATQEGQTIAYYKVEVTMPTSAGNEYQMAELRADFNWFVQDTGPLLPPTGDNSHIYLWVGLLAGSLVMILILLFFRRKDKKEEEHAEGK